MRVFKSCFLLFLLSTGALPVLVAAPGDLVATVSLPPPCDRGVISVAFDGSVLYYKIRVEPVLGTIHKADAATGTALGSFVLTREGTPIGVGGLGYDANRNALWTSGSSILRLFSRESGEVTWEFMLLRPGTVTVAHDALSDRLWETNLSPNQLTCWYANGDLCGGIGSAVTDRGLTFDGAHLWHFTPSYVPPPVDATGVLYPTDLIGTIDYDRAIDIPTGEYNTIAYDCVTFPVDVIWVANNIACELLAFEVDSRGPCLLEPGNRLLRAFPRDPASRAEKLPVRTEVADRIWRVFSPVDHVDPDVVTQQSRPLVFYRVLGPTDDDDPGNLLRMAKDAAGTGVHARE